MQKDHVGFDSRIGEAVQFACDGCTVPERGPARQLEAVRVDDERGADSEHRGARGVERAGQHAQPPAAERIDTEPCHEGVQRKCAEKILRLRRNAHDAGEQCLAQQPEQRHGSDLVAHRQVPAASRRSEPARHPPAAECDAEPDQRIDEPRRPLRRRLQRRQGRGTGEVFQIVGTAQEPPAEQGRKRAERPRAAAGIAFLHRAGKARGELSGDLEKIERVQREKRNAEQGK